MMPPELETSYRIDNDHPDQPPEDIAAISELISPREEGESEPEQEVQAPKSEVEQPPEMAEVEAEPELEAPQEIDYDMEIPMPNAESVTLGELKDQFDRNRDLQQERETWEAHQSEQQLQMMATRQKLFRLAESLQDIPPEVMQRAEELQAIDDQREAAMLAEVFPQWADADKKAAARTEHIEMIKEYGFTDIDYAGIRDHRLIKLLDDLTRLRKREAAGKAKREELKSKVPKGQKPVQRKQTPVQERAALIQRAKRGTQQDKIAAISSLISEG